MEMRLGEKDLDTIDPVSASLVVGPWPCSTRSVGRSVGHPDAHPVAHFGRHSLVRLCLSSRKVGRREEKIRRKIRFVFDTPFILTSHLLFFRLSFVLMFPNFGLDQRRHVIMVSDCFCPGCCLHHVPFHAHLRTGRDAHIRAVCGYLTDD